MEMTVKDMIEFQQFEGFRVIAGNNGLGRKVRAVSVMDAPDIHEWLRGGEFLMTTGYIMRENPEEITTLIRNIHHVGAAALGIKLGRFITELPESAIRLAEELSFPLVLVPYQYSFVEVINPVLEQIIERQSRQLYFSERIHNSFTNLVIDGGGSDKIVEVLYEVTGRDICYYNTVFREKICCINGTSSEHILNIDELSKPQNKLDYTVILEDKVVGYIVLGERNSDDYIDEAYMAIAIEHASTVLKLDLQKRISNRQLENKYRSELLQDLILDNISSLDELQSRAHLYGWKFRPSICVAIVDIDRFKERYVGDDGQKRDLDTWKEQLFERCTNQLRSHISGVRFTQFSDSVVYIFQGIETNGEIFRKKVDDIFHSIANMVRRETGFSITIGVGENKRELLNTHISYTEAKKAVRLGRMLFGGDRVIYYDELGAFRLLEYIDEKPLKKFQNEYLEDLFMYDEAHGTSYVETLRVLYQSDWVAKDAAKVLFVHYNTIRARIEKIQEILDINLGNIDTKLNLSIALKIADLRYDDRKRSL